MREWIVRGSFASFSRERESLISKPRNKPLGSNWERIERVKRGDPVILEILRTGSNWERIESLRIYRRQRVANLTLEATGKELKADGALRRWITFEGRKQLGKN